MQYLAIKFTFLYIALVAGLLSQQTAVAFTTPSQRIRTAGSDNARLTKVQPGFSVATLSKDKELTRLSMYNLPPNRNNNELGDIVKGAASLVLVVAFFASPLGGFVLGIFNSFLLVSLLLPAVGAIAFSAWQYFNTVSAPCPNCGAPARVIKTTSEGESTPSICFNCGAVIQANYENTGIDNVTGRNTVDSLSSPNAGGVSIFDIFGGPQISTSYTETTTTTTTTTTSPSTSVIQEDRPRTKSTEKRGDFIDVEIEDIDKPWQ